MKGPRALERGCFKNVTPLFFDWKCSGNCKTSPGYSKLSKMATIVKRIEKLHKLASSVNLAAYSFIVGFKFITSCVLDLSAHLAHIV